MESIELDKPVANFSLPSTAGHEFTLSMARGKYLIIYFYPKDNTPGCTRESQAFRDYYSEFQALGAEIVGISRDSLSAHQRFKAAQQLPFELLSDPTEQVCRQFDVIKLKNNYGKLVEGIERSTFLLDPQAHLRKIWRKVKVDGHVADVLAALKQLPNG